MKKAMLKILQGIFIFSAVFICAQEKTKFSDISNVLQKIIPSDRIDSWILIFNDYGKDAVIASSGKKIDFTPQFSGFDLFPDEDSFYYIAYLKAGKVEYITDLDKLKEFIGKVDNVQEAAIDATIDGYFIDPEFKDVAGNYYEDKSSYFIDLGKLTSKECPYQKTHFTLTVNKSTGTITQVKDNGPYIELYNKKCTNNPRLLKIEKKEEPKDEPKKSTRKR